MGAHLMLCVGCHAQVKLVEDASAAAVAKPKAAPKPPKAKPATATTKVRECARV